MIAGVAMKVHLFQMRACFSGACFVQAHTRETQQAFLEGHVAALEFFGGVFGLIRYDNLGSAVKRVFRGRRRVETDRFVAPGARARRPPHGPLSTGGYAFPHPAYETLNVTPFGRLAGQPVVDGGWEVSLTHRLNGPGSTTNWPFSL